MRPDYFTDWKAAVASRGLLPHAYSHSWDGKFRRPDDLTTANYNIPMQDLLLWIYEGETQYVGNVLAARSGLMDTDTARDVQAAIAAAYDARAGRVWRNLQDTTNQPIVGGRADTEWTDWLRGADYYDEMIVRSGDYFKNVTIDYRNGSRHPHLVRVAGTPDRLTAIFAPR